MNAFEESQKVSDIFLHTTAAGAITCVSFARTGVKNGSGPKMRLRDQALICDCSQLAVPLLLWSNSVMLWTNGQVLQTEKGMQYFHDNLKKQFEA